MHKIKILIGIIGLVVVFVMVITLSATKVECYTQFGPCPESLSSSLQSVVPVRLVGGQPKQKVSQALKSFQYIKSYDVYRRLPSTIVVAIELSRPVAYITNNSKVLGVSTDSGSIISATSGLSLPELEIQGLSEENKIVRLNEVQLKAVANLIKVSTLVNTKVSGKLDGYYLSVNIGSKMPIIMLDIKNDTSSWYSPLQTILERSRISSKIPTKIDLRFNQPVLSYD